MLRNILQIKEASNRSRSPIRKSNCSRERKNTNNQYKNEERCRSVNAKELNESGKDNKSQDRSNVIDTNEDLNLNLEEITNDENTDVNFTVSNFLVNIFKSIDDQRAEMKKGYNTFLTPNNTKEDLEVNNSNTREFYHNISQSAHEAIEKSDTLNKHSSHSNTPQTIHKEKPNTPSHMQTLIITKENQMLANAIISHYPKQMFKFEEEELTKIVSSKPSSSLLTSKKFTKGLYKDNYINIISNCETRQAHDEEENKDNQNSEWSKKNTIYFKLPRNNDIGNIQKDLFVKRKTQNFFLNKPNSNEMTNQGAKNLVNDLKNESIKQDTLKSISGMVSPYKKINNMRTLNATSKNSTRNMKHIEQSNTNNKTDSKGAITFENTSTELLKNKECESKNVDKIGKFNVKMPSYNFNSVSTVFDSEEINFKAKTKPISTQLLNQTKYIQDLEIISKEKPKVYHPLPSYSNKGSPLLYNQKFKNGTSYNLEK